MKKYLLLTLSLLVLVIFQVEAQRMNKLPYSTDIEKFPDGWHKFAIEGVAFDVEILNGNLVKGNIVWTDGSNYSGRLSGAFLSGKGTYVWPNGVRYEGAFRKGQRNGKGSLIGPDGSKWSGKWKNNQRNGKGKKFDSDGSIVKEGVWEANKYIRSKK